MVKDGLFMLDINDIEINSLTRIDNVAGDVLHVLKCSDNGFKSFGESYFSWIHYNSIKAWKRHKRMTMNLVVPIGRVRFVFYSTKQNKFRIEDIGESRYCRITVPAGIWFGFKGLSQTSSLILNTSDIMHDPNEVDRLDLYDIRYSWE